MITFSSDFFNWTLSNRFDADIFIPKGTIVPRGDRSEIFNKNPSWEEWTGQVSDSEILDIKKEYMSTTGKVG